MRASALRKLINTCFKDFCADIINKTNKTKESVKMSNRFTDKAERALNNAIKIAEELGHTYIGSEHILLSLSKEEDSTAGSILKKYGITHKLLEQTVKNYSGFGSKSTLSPKDMTPCCKKIVENSYKVSVRYGAVKIGTEHVLLAIMEEKSTVALKLLSLKNADTVGITDELLTVLRTAERNNPKNKPQSDNVQSPLKQYGKNLTALALQEKFDPVIGREKETERVIRILSRKNKNNPCLIGEAGVGKTAIVEGLAYRIAKKQVPLQLIDKEIICIDLSSMVSGTKYRGDFEERIKATINEAVAAKNIILFIDEVHTIVGAGAAEGAIDAANILKPQLSRAEIQLIGATTFAEYHRYIEKDAALERRFQPVIVEEPTEEDTIAILMGVKERYEKHHNVKISEEAVKTAVSLSNRYIRDRFLPDKALDVIDEAAAKLNSQMFAVSSTGFFDNTEFNIEQFKDNDNIKNSYNEESLLPTVTEKSVKEIINEMTGIPIWGLEGNAKSEELKTSLSRKIIGQDFAIETLAAAVMRSKLGINSPDRPKGVFMFLGGSGVGKTELAKALAEELFFDKNSFFSFDMSEFSEKNSVNKFIGSPPGYVGYEEGGGLTEKIRRHPYSVVLFDEIEKAHPDVLDLFLQITDTGTLTDSQGRSVSFKNCYIIFTSNVGASSIQKSIGFVNSKSEKVKNLKNKLKEFFRIEFLNRIDEIIPFSQINKATMSKIATNKLIELKERVKKIGISLTFTDDVAINLSEKCSDESYGARELIRLITNDIENLISSYIINNESKKNYNLIIYVEDGEIKAKEKSAVGV